MAYIGQEPGLGQAERFIFTASGAEEVVSTADDGRLIGYTVGQVSVYLNGVKLALGTDFTATNGSTITLIGNSPALSASDVVEVIALSAFSPSDTVSAASGGTFSGAVTASAGFTANTADINGGTIDGSTITSPVINTGVSGTAVLDSDTMSGASATTISSSESIKAYVDGVGAQTASTPQALGTGNAVSFSTVTSNNTAKAWCNYKSTGTLAVRDDYNISTVGYISSGMAQFNFTTAMGNTNYATVGSATYELNGLSRLRILSPYYQKTGYVQVSTGYSDTAHANHDQVCLIVFGD